MIARHVHVTGEVQGVCFRAWTREQAQALDVVGWVRNCPDGSVEAHVEGAEAAVGEMLERLRRGSPAANVEDLRIWDVEPCEFEDFEMRL